MKTILEQREELRKAWVEKPHMRGIIKRQNRALELAEKYRKEHEYKVEQQRRVIGN